VVLVKRFTGAGLCKSLWKIIICGVLWVLLIILNVIISGQNLKFSDIVWMLRHVYFLNFLNVNVFYILFEYILGIF